MAFKKLDSDAVSSTLSRPLDAFVCQQVDANIREAYTERGRGAGKSYGADDRPTLASVGAWCVPLSPWHISPGCTEITCKLRGLATSDGAGGDAIKARLILQTTSGAVHSGSLYTTISDDASVQEVELTFDTEGLEGEVVVVWLVFVSEQIPTSTATDTRHDTDIGSFDYRLNLGNTIGATFDDDKRWRVDFAEDASGSDPEEFYGYPGPRMIMGKAGGAFGVNHVLVYPRLNGRISSYHTFQVTITELGRFELYGWSLTETTISEPAPLTDALRPAMIPRARTFSEMYRRERELVSERTRVVHVGGTPTPHLFNYQWGTQRTYIEDTTQEAYVALGGELPTYRVNTTSATLTYRLRYRALMLVVAATADAEVRPFNISTEVTITDVGGGNTQNPTVTGGEAELTPVTSATMAENELPGSVHVYGHFSEVNHLNGRWSLNDVLRGRTGLHLLDLTFEEASAVASTSARVIRIQFQTQDVEPALPASTNDNQNRIYFPACTILVDEGF
jgi:hypothetical protein